MNPCKHDKVYEYVSLGGTCAVANYLRSGYQAYPFDWCKMSIKALNKVLKADFADFSKLEVKKFSQNHPYITDDSIEETQGSLVLENSYGIQFAHQIIDKDLLPTFIVRLEERIGRFRQLSNVNKTTFVRFESGKLKSDYSDDLKELLNNLTNIMGIPFKFILIVHKDSISMLATEIPSTVTVHCYDTFSPDWKYLQIFTKEVLGF